MNDAKFNDFHELKKKIFNKRRKNINLLPLT